MAIGGEAMLTESIHAYLFIRRVGGFILHADERLLLDFASYAADRGEEHIQTTTAIEWAAGAKSLTHFGTIPGTPKPSLWKAGAEVLCMTFRLAPLLDSRVIVDEPESEGPTPAQGGAVMLSPTYASDSSRSRLPAPSRDRRERF
jgi:hypothetical protein